MQVVVDTFDEQIKLLMQQKIDVNVSIKNVLQRVLTNLRKFKITYIVVYYFILLLTTLIFKDIYPSLITTVFLMLLGMVMMKHTISIQFDSWKISVGLELFIIALLSLPIFVSLVTDSFPHFLSSIIIGLLPVIAHALVTVEKGKEEPKKKEKKDKKSSSSSSSED